MTEIGRCRLEIVLLEVGSQSRTQRKANSTERMNFGADPRYQKVDGRTINVSTIYAEKGPVASINNGGHPYRT